MSELHRLVRFPVMRAIQKGDYQIYPGTDRFSQTSMRVAMELLRRSDPALWHVQNVYEYMPPLKGKETRSYDDMSFGEIPSTPPFADCWIEFIVPAGDTWYGAAICQVDDREWNLNAYMGHLWSDGTLPARRKILILPGSLTFRYDDGGILDQESLVCSFPAGMNDDADRDPIFDTLRSIHSVALTAFMFSHCKNVELVERLPKRHEQRAAKRRGEPILKYHEIVIDPNRTQQPSTGANRHDDTPQRALHIARGHFAHYTEERPLFGKYVGTFWRPAHVRGSAELGEVKSTYRVKPRKDDAA